MVDIRALTSPCTTNIPQSGDMRESTVLPMSEGYGGPGAKPQTAACPGLPTSYAITGASARPIQLDTATAGNPATRSTAAAKRTSGSSTMYGADHPETFTILVVEDT